MEKISYLIKLNDIWVPNYLENMDFPRNSLHIGLILDLILLEDFDSDFLTCDEMSSQTHLSECTLTE